MSLEVLFILIVFHVLRMKTLCLVTVLALTWGWSDAYFSPFHYGYDSNDHPHGHLTHLGEIVSDGVRFLISPFESFGHNFMSHFGHSGHHYYRPYPAPSPSPHYHRRERVGGVQVGAYAEAKKTVES